MPTYFARKSGSINASDVWATTPSGTAAAVTFASGDVLVANSFTVTVNVSTDLGATGQVRNDTTGGATAGGTFSLNNGVTLTANVFGGGGQGNFCVNGNSLLAGQSASLVGNLTNGTGATDMASFGSTGAGTVNITGNLTGGVGAGGRNAGAQITGPTTINFSGNITGGTGGNGVSEGMSINNASAVLNFQNGNITGGSGGSSNGGNFGINITSAASVTINGNVIGGGARSSGANQHAGLNNASSTTTVTINGNAVGGTFFSGVLNSGNGPISITRAIGNAYGPGNTTGLAAAPGVTNSGLGVVTIDQIEYGTFGQSPTSGAGIRLRKANTNVAVFNYANTAGAKTLIDATANAAMPAATDVRNGVSYASGALTGIAFIPSPSSVASGVPVDNTTGTAVLTLANVQSALTAQGLTSARAGALDNLDTTVSSRLSPSGTLARVTLTDTATTLTNAPTVPTAAEIATAVEGSLLNEADGQAVLNAIVGAIGNTNLSEVSLVAAVRADLERTGGKLDSIPTTAAPSASSVAGAVRTELGVELGRLDASVSSRLSPSGTLATVTNLTNAPASVTPSDIWSHSSRTLTSASGPTAVEIRQEIDANSTKLDAAISSRMAASEATKLDAIKVKTDGLNIERLSNVATTNIVGTLLAQANS